MALSEWFGSHAANLLAALLIFLVGKWLARRLSRLIVVLLDKGRVDRTLVTFLKNIIYYVLLVVVMIAAAEQLGINTTSLLTIVGAAGLAVALALKDSLGNFAAGVMLIIFRPFQVGDYITVSGAEGKVMSISIFNTVFNTGDNKKVIVPNGKIINDVITNVNANPTRRVDLVFGISYEDDLLRARELLAGIVAGEARILADPPPRIAVAELADSSVNLVVRPWVNTPDYWDVYFELTEKVKLAFDSAGITIPYPQRDVHLHQEKAAGQE